MTKSRFLEVQYGLGAMRNNFIFDLMEDTMSKVVQGGIIQYFEKFISEFVLRAEMDEGKTLKSFGIEDLKFGFVIHLIACGVSSFVFIFEIFAFYLKNICGLMGVLRGLKKFDI